MSDNKKNGKAQSRSTRRGGAKPPRGEAKSYDHLLTACTRDPRVPAAAKGLFAYMVQNRQAIRTGAVSETAMRAELCMFDDERQDAIAILEKYGYLPGGGEHHG